MKARLRIEKKRAFSAVPDDILTDQRLSLDARAVLSYLVGRPAGWTFFVAQVQHALGVTDLVWSRVRRELEAAGYYRQNKTRDAAGKIGWDIVVFDTPELPQEHHPSFTTPGKTIPGKTIPGKAGDGGAMYGKPGDITEKGMQRRETQERNTPRERAEGCKPSAGRAGGPLSDKGVAGKYLTDSETGISLQEGNAQDTRVLHEIKQHSAPEIAAAVARARAAEPSGRAYPSAVVRLLRRGGTPAGTPAWARAGRGSPAQVHEIDITEEGETL